MVRRNLGQCEGVKFVDQWSIINVREVDFVVWEVKLEL